VILTILLFLCIPPSGELGQIACAMPRCVEILDFDRRSGLALGSAILRYSS
jgi:hypothetical protein